MVNAGTPVRNSSQCTEMAQSLLVNSSKAKNDSFRKDSSGFTQGRVISGKNLPEIDKIRA
jgi:hypothetical protein